MRFPDTRARKSGFTVFEVLIAMGIFGIATGALLISWIGLQTTAANTTAYAQRQSDQMRVIDYLKRDIHRATGIAIYDAGNPVTGNNFGTELRLTIPQYYADAREEDNAVGSRIPNQPTLAGDGVVYGAQLTVRYFVTNGAVIRNESGVSRTVADSAGAFVLSFCRDPSGMVRARVFFNQLLMGGRDRMLRREVNVLCGQRSQLQL